MHAAGYSPTQLMEGGYNAKDVGSGCGLGVGELLELGYEVADLCEAGFPAKELYEGDDEYDGVSIAEMRDAGYLQRELDALGKSMTALKAGGFSAGELRHFGFSAAELRAARFPANHVLSAGYSLKEIRAGGYDWKQCVTVLRATHAELLEAGYPILGIASPSDPIFESGPGPSA